VVRIPSLAAVHSSLTKQASEATACYISIIGTFGEMYTNTVQFNPDINSSSQLTFLGEHFPIVIGP
jgi:hypothetical protein